MMAKVRGSRQEQSGNGGMMMAKTTMKQMVKWA
jgi:hypothetical protein